MKHANVGLSLPSLMLSFCALLAGCGEQNKNQEQMRIWVQAQVLQAQEASNAEKQRSIQDLADYRLLRVPTLNGSHVFADMKAVQQGFFQDLDKANASTEPTHVAKSADPWGLGNGMSMPNNATFLGLNEPPIVEVVLDLTQANREQIKYLGMMSVDGQQIGLVQVGSRVFRVMARDRIGQGQWQVVSLDTARMQLSMDGQIVDYAK